MREEGPSVVTEEREETAVTRQEHLQWSKDRALRYVDQNDLNGAFQSIDSDLQKHPELQQHPGLMIGIGLLVLGKLNTQAEMRKFITDFN
jgi:hypothetical protein